MSSSSAPTWPIALTIAGSDSGGGAGIQADLKSFAANRTFGASVITALTAQNTLGVTAIHDVPVDFIRAQMDAVFSDLDVKAVKIGMLSQPQTISTITQCLRDHSVETIVLDPVMVATSGAMLLAEEAVETLKTELLPMATVITPNLHEAAKLADMDLAETEHDMKNQAKAILAAGANNVLIKGGHFGDGESADMLASRGREFWFRTERIDTNNTHGTGCSLSSAIAANLAHGMALDEAVEAAKTWLTAAIAASGQLDVGQGPGPVHHFHHYWKSGQDT